MPGGMGKEKDVCVLLANSWWVGELVCGMLVCVSVYQVQSGVGMGLS